MVDGRKFLVREAGECGCSSVLNQNPFFTAKVDNLVLLLSLLCVGTTRSENCVDFNSMQDYTGYLLPVDNMLWIIVFSTE